MSEFEQLFDAIALKRQGRHNAAKAQMDSLSPKFKMLILKWLTERFKLNDFLVDCTEVVLKTPYGLFLINNQTISDFKTFVPQLL